MYKKKLDIDKLLWIGNRQCEDMLKLKQEKLQLEEKTKKLNRLLKDNIIFQYIRRYVKESEIPMYNKVKGRYLLNPEYIKFTKEIIKPDTKYSVLNDNNFDKLSIHNLNVVFKFGNNIYVYYDLVQYPEFDKHYINNKIRILYISDSNITIVIEQKHSSIGNTSSSRTYFFKLELDRHDLLEKIKTYAEDDTQLHNAIS